MKRKGRSRKYRGENILGTVRKAQNIKNFPYSISGDLNLILMLPNLI